MINYSIVEGNYLVSYGSVVFEEDLPTLPVGQSFVLGTYHIPNGLPEPGQRWNIMTNSWEDVRTAAEKLAAKPFEISAARYAEYPPLGDFADAMYHNSRGDPSYLAAYFDKCEVVKQKYPKTNN